MVKGAPYLLLQLKLRQVDRGGSASAAGEGRNSSLIHTHTHTLLTGELGRVLGREERSKRTKSSFSSLPLPMMGGGVWEKEDEEIIVLHVVVQRTLRERTNN